MPISPEPFKSLPWALHLFSDPQWTASIRGSRLTATANQDCFNRKTMRSNDGVRHWYEFYKKPSTPDGLVTDAATLVTCGPGLMGFPGMMHAGAMSTLVDEALAWGMLCVAKHNGELVDGRDSLEDEGEEKELELAGWMATAWLNIKYLRPVPCPGVIGFETEVNDLGKKIELSCVVKNAKGEVLVKGEGLWVRMKGTPKI
ncbi:uncharacterized protein BDZ99DRAFT_459110 [Mytilinidion resinicola]|uniref:Thioesterase domain-containing protein n=1 Tax=Mytilinidion resinicola TaxID=574789 RepID=A0A6A6Z207_9PEZI|nr:uncharacterized protein BDZ99DRAFT_459110 [Mytilinidion resinicola]KAF2815176.1 hypothetical protein BDZ99DRAFT_459110 [Mytilinidion resinicola]